ncbi:MAG: glycosyltransferase [Cytophagales bacterium]|nr:glycosyltransferase [Cytophagales bacterium]
MSAVSVVIPFYKPGESFRRCLKSLAAQSFSDFEALLVGNNPDALSISIAREFVKADRRFRILEENRQGVVFASNRGMQAANGDYLVRMDSDDWMHPERLEKQLRFLEENPFCDAVSCLVQYEGVENAEGFRHYVEWVNRQRTPEEIFSSRFVESPVVNPTFMVRKSVPERLGWYREGSFPEDYELWLRWLHAGVRVCKITEVLHYWSDSPDRLTRTDSRYAVNSFFRLKTDYVAGFLQQRNIESVCVWGAGKRARQRLEYLREKGIQVHAFLDLKTKSVDGIPCHAYSDYDYDGREFILSYVTNRGKGDEVRAYLESRGLKAEEHFLCLG